MMHMEKTLIFTVSTCAAEERMEGGAKRTHLKGK